MHSSLTNNVPLASVIFEWLLTRKAKSCPYEVSILPKWCDVYSFSLNNNPVLEFPLTIYCRIDSTALTRNITWTMKADIQAYYAFFILMESIFCCIFYYIVIIFLFTFSIIFFSWCMFQTHSLMFWKVNKNIIKLQPQKLSFK